MILIKNANLISMEEVNYKICDILLKDNLIKKIGASGLDTESRVRLIEMLNNKH